MGMGHTAALELLEREIEQRLAGREGLIVAIDGRCASGKTTLANALAARRGWGVVHLDHFYLRPEQRTPQRYQTPGENVDYERFLEQVLLPLERGEAAVYHPFDCRTQSLGAPIRIAAGGVILVEGAYSCHRELWAHYGLRVLLTVSPQVQRQRLLEREGAQRLQVFQEKWIPLEERYFAACDLARRCDCCLEL